MRKNRLFLLLSLFLPIILGIYSVNNIWAQEEPKPIQTENLQPEEGPIVTTTGRLVLEKHGESEWLVLQAKDAETYVIKGGLVEKLSSLLLDLEKDNLVTVTGKQDGSYNTSCTNTYGYDSKGNRVVDTQCIRYYILEVTQILEAKKSAEEIPPPKRDVEEERKAMVRALSQLPKQGLVPQIITKEGTISSVNLRAPIKTIEIAYLDKDNQPRKGVLLISPNTRIAKRNIADDKEPIYVTANSLQIGQEVTVVYSRDELKSEALFITITKE